jgi:hypothetical protein
MLSQAQVFVRDTPFEALSRVRQALAEIDAALAHPGDQPDDRASLLALRKVAVSRAAKYETRLNGWIAEAESRANLFTANERARLAQPMRAKV